MVNATILGGIFCLSDPTFDLEDYKMIDITTKNVVSFLSETGKSIF
jgi:hypothetical protein